MQRYIEQLISDIRSATHNSQPPNEIWMESGANPDNELELEDMSYVEDDQTSKVLKTLKV